MKIRIFLLSSLLIAGGLFVDSALARAPKGKKAKTEASADTTAKKAKPEKGSIAAVIDSTKAKYHKGLLTVVEQEGKYFFLMPKSLLGRDLLVVNRISKAPAGLRSGFTGYAGDQIAEIMIRFAKSPDGKTVFLENISTRELPRDTTGAMYQNVMRSNMQPIDYAFEIKGKNKAADTLLIDVTDFFGGDNELSGFDEWVKGSLEINSFQKDKSYIIGAKSFPNNTDVQSVKTYSFRPSGTLWNGKPYPAQAVTFQLNTSIIALPEVPMQPRYADDRVGYFSESYVDFDSDPQGVKAKSMITRWRLEPKPEDVEKYKAGQLVEPIEQIIYYIDPTTPAKWVPYLIAGVNDWEPVFRKAGFKNAIKAMVAPTVEQDSTWSLDDARHSAIVYKPSTIPNASGPHVHDPRTGQILESHVNWYHNVMSLVRNWYMLQAGPNDKRAQKLEFPEELMGDLIRFVSSHEIGHTLGLRHNFGATSCTPVDSLRSRNYLLKNGHTPSIMDYSRFNYAVQPEDGIEPQLQYPRIQDYDNWAIEWGYRRFPDLKTADSEKAKLNEWIIEANKNPRLWFGHEMNPDDPRSQSEDLGDNQMKANALGIKNLQRVIKGLPEWAKENNEGFDKLEELYGEVFGQYMRYVGHVAKWVGGIYQNPRTVEQGTDVYSYVEKEKQVEAMNWLVKYWLTTPQWLLDNDIFTRTGLNSNVIMTNAYNSGFMRLLTPRAMNNMISAEAALGSKSYTIGDFFNTLTPAVMVSTPDVHQRIAQKIYVDRLLSMVSGERINTKSDMTSVVMAQLRSIQSRLSAAQVANSTIAAHNKYLVQRIKDTLDRK
ncbi:MAG: zinc-dependent metalloprotease [Mucinivorans sp.]